MSEAKRPGTYAYIIGMVGRVMRRPTFLVAGISRPNCNIEIT
jgi:hypothetical protein